VIAPKLAQSRGWQPVEVMEEGRGHVFGVQITVEDLDRGKKHVLQTDAGQPTLWLAPGRYRVLSQASRLGFPQEVRYEIVDAATGRIARVIPKSHVAVDNVTLQRGEQLRVVVLPAVRPYNAVFYAIGSPSVDIAHVVARPYPSFEAGRGEYAGMDQFPNAPMSIAFWGGKRARERPELAAQIRSAGVPVPGGDRVSDPVLVLGVREVASDLAATFVRERRKHQEDYRGHHHITALVRRDAQGCLPPFLLRLSESVLRREFERQLLWMMHHNVHRPNEGGGYAGKTFLEDLREADGKLEEWLRTSRDSTAYFRQSVVNLEMRFTESDGRARIQSDGDRDVLVGEALQDALVGLATAAHRERTNYATYDPEVLRRFEQTLLHSVQSLASAATDTIASALKHLRQIAPERAAELAEQLH